LLELSKERGIETKQVRLAVRNGSIPTERALLKQILDAIRDEIDAGRPVYVHCWEPSAAPAPRGSA